MRISTLGTQFFYSCKVHIKIAMIKNSVIIWIFVFDHSIYDDALEVLYWMLQRGCVRNFHFDIFQT